MSQFQHSLHLVRGGREVAVLDIVACMHTNTQPLGVTEAALYIQSDRGNQYQACR